jgi:hypothetical protein
VVGRKNGDHHHFGPHLRPGDFGLMRVISFDSEHLIADWPYLLGQRASSNTPAGRGEMDFTPVKGAAAISLATRLTAESFSLARAEPAVHSRQSVAVRFVPRTRV